MKADSDLWQKICNEETFHQAWRKVKANMGGPGVDRHTIEDFEANLSENISLLRDLLKQGVYQPLPLMDRETGREDGAKRILKIPAIRDRVVQEAVLLVLQPILDRNFLDCCYGYRPKRSAPMAVRRIERNLKKGREWIVDGDIQDFFDTVNQALLVNLFSERISEPRIVKLVKDWIGFSAENGAGIPQGAVISPLLANIYLHPLDVRMIKGPGHYIRYCDDFIILCESQDEAQTSLQKVRKCLEEDLYLKVNQEKTRICHTEEGFVFLGFQFAKDGKKPSPKSMDRLKAKIKKELEVSQGSPNVDLSKKVKIIIRGWQNYFQLESCEQANLLKEIDAIIVAHNESIPAHILKAALCIESGKREEAYEIISGKMDLPSEDEQIHYQWGILCDAIGMEGEARDKYFESIKKMPDHKESVFQLGLSYLKEGNTEKAIRFLQKAAHLSPESPEVHMALGMALEKWGLHGAAYKAINQAKALDPNLKIIPPRKTVSEEVEKAFATSFSEEDLNLFLKLFSGREGVYARQWIDGTGRSGYHPVNKPLSRNDLLEHLEGKSTLGLYLMRSDNTVKVAVIDIDVSKKTIEASWSENSEFPLEWQNIVQRDANKIVDLLRNFGLSVYTEISGWKGIHLWLFFEQPVRAIEVRNFLKEIMRKVGLPAPGIHREIFPKQDAVGKEGLGCLIKLPLGIHMMTQKRAVFVDREGKPYENQVGYLWQISPIALDGLRETIPKLRLQKEEIEYEPLDKGLVQKVLDNCNVLRFLAKKAKKERDLRHFERLTLLHTLGHMGEAGRQAIHQIIGNCLNYSYDRTERWIKRMHIFPVSCPRIREWLSDVTPSIGCYCEFPVPEKGYPSPILHADLEAIIRIREGGKAEKIDFQERVSKIEEEKLVEPVPSSPMKESPSTPEDNPDELVKTYIYLKKDRRGIEERLKEVERKLDILFQSKGIDSLQIEIGNLTRIPKGDKTCWVIEL
jgi:group II intron reverse transcriptase/maturase